MKLTQRLLSDAPLIESGALIALAQAHRAALAEHPGITALRDRMKPKMELMGDVAVVPISGLLAKKPDVFEMFSGVEDSDSIVEMIEKAEANDSIKGVLLDIDSPGGFATSLDAADAVGYLKRKKPVVAYSGSMAASLAYYIATQATEIVAGRNALVGSIGVVATHTDFSRLYDAAGIKIEVFRNKEADYKAPGALGTALTDAQREHIQERVQTAFQDFRSAVRANRPGVPDAAMRGQLFSGSEGKGQRLVDRVGGRTYALSAIRALVRQYSTNP